MSDIWHITNKNEKPTDIPEKENFVVLIGHWTSCLWYGGEEPEPIFWDIGRDGIRLFYRNK